MAPKPDGTPAASSSNTSITSGGGAVAGRRVAASIPRPERRRSEHTAARDASSASLPSRREASSQLRRIGEEVAARSWMAACEAEARRAPSQVHATEPRCIVYTRVECGAGGGHQLPFLFFCLPPPRPPSCVPGARGAEGEGRGQPKQMADASPCVQS